MNITGYRTNTDYTETLAWFEQADGSVICDHNHAVACGACVEADSRLAHRGSRVVVANWPANAVREGRAVRYVSLAG